MLPFVLFCQLYSVFLLSIGNTMKSTLYTNTSQLFTYRYLTVAIMGIFAQQALANEANPITPETDLSVITVTVDDQPKESVSEKITTREELNQQNVQSSHDLVRYNAEVDVAEVGRYGNRGFAIRGVDGNRVNMNIDGVSLPEVESNEIFSPYGYMYEGRLNPDLEMMGSVRVQAGSDSLISGSGAVGGSVTYNTKEPDDLIRSGNNLGGYAKVGYTNKNDELLTAVGLAGRYDKFEAVVNYSRRVGHETKNHAMRKYDKKRLDPTYTFSIEEMPKSANSAIYPDPMHYEREAILGKFYYNLDDSHRFGLHGIHQYGLTHLNAESKNVNFGSRNGSNTRRAFDEDELTSYGINYRYRPMSHDWLNELNVNYTNNHVYGIADTWIYNRTQDFLNSTPNNTIFTEVYLFNREYRPNETKTNQLSLDVKSQEFDWGKLGLHQFDFNSSYIKQDYLQSANYLKYEKNGQWNSADSFINFSFPDNKKTNYNFSFIDNIEWSDKLKTTLGVRYDNYHYQPYFEDTILAVGGANSPKSEIQKNQATCNNSTALICQITTDNYSKLPEAKFSQLTWSSAFDYQITDNLAGRYKVGTGFLAPTTTQMYSTFEQNAVRQVPNIMLKPEKSLNHDLEFQYDWHNTSFTVGGYLMKYKDFIHTKYWEGNGSLTEQADGCIRNFTCLQSVNLDNAEVKGLRLGVKGSLSNWLNLDGDLDYSLDYHTSRDKAIIETDYDGKLEINTLASVPTSAILGLDYTSPVHDWTLHAKVRYMGRKSADDAKSLEVVRTPNSTNPYKEVVSTYKNIDRSQSATLLDIYGTKRFGADRNWILNAGIYNVTNKQYMPWETLRQFAVTSVNNMVDINGYGFARYTAPGRNYALSLTYEF